MPDAPSAGEIPEPAASIGMHHVLDVPFEDAVPYVQLEHEYVGYETVRVTRLDRMIGGALDEAVPRTALLVVCHPEIARDALAIDPRLGGLLPCTTVVYESPGESGVHVHHVSVAKAVRDLGYAPTGSADAVDRLVDRSAESMGEVWENIEVHADAARITDDP